MTFTPVTVFSFVAPKIELWPGFTGPSSRLWGRAFNLILGKPNPILEIPTLHNTTNHPGNSTLGNPNPIPGIPFCPNPNPTIGNASLTVTLGVLLLATLAVIQESLPVLTLTLAQEPYPWKH